MAFIAVDRQKVANLSAFLKLAIAREKSKGEGIKLLEHPVLPPRYRMKPGTVLSPFAKLNSYCILTMTFCCTYFCLLKPK